MILLVLGFVNGNGIVRLFQKSTISIPSLDNILVFIFMPIDKVFCFSFACRVVY